MVGQFAAMASDCQVLLETDDFQLAARVLSGVAAECRRIEAKYSRYRADSVISQIQQQAGQAVQVDAETTRLLNFADLLYQLSDGLFDITSGVLRQVWRFDGSDRLPTADAVAALLPQIGWSKVDWSGAEGRIVLPQGMQLDLGGIGKEYAVDRCFDWVKNEFSGAFLINFGGDLRAQSWQSSGVRQNGQAWQVGIEQPDQAGSAVTVVELGDAALATSGDAKRYLFKDGVRYGHILNPKTGWPVVDVPRSLTVQAATCTQAGMLATLAMLQGAGAADFLAEQANEHPVDQVVERTWIVD
ncbi:MAG: FAD:protein FMN transferase [Pseudomonadota bacterium]|nr:FAD:protein FMN transferase [Pseudomonadota bacterium]